MTRRHVVALSIVAVGGLLVGEIAIRATGITDFPLYKSSSDLGYAVAPNQKGVFLNRNHWIYNEKSQGAPPWNPNGETDLLLLGDSLVLGGNPIDQPLRLGPQLAQCLPGWQVWPASAGSWSVANEIAYLKRFPEVSAAVGKIVWVVNTGDLAGPSVWQSEFTHPRSHPDSALWYVFNKYVVLPRLGSGGDSVIPDDPISPATVEALRSQLAFLRKQNPQREILFVLYPTQEELNQTVPAMDASYKKFLDVLVGAVGATPVLEIRKDPRWKPDLYRDGIHPNAEGNRILAAIIAEHLDVTTGNASP